MTTRKAVLIMALGVVAVSSFAQPDFNFQGKEVAAGEKEHFQVLISDEKDSSFIPITVFHGKQSGPVLGITAGVHGYEYSPILAGQLLIDKIEPETLKGTVILVQVANVGSFLGRSPYTNPMDGKNLNRTFPGSPNGTMTERIADFISNQVIARCTHFVDVHSGDAPEDLTPYSGFYHHDDKPGISQQGRHMATHLGFDYVLTFETTGKAYMQQDNPSLYCSAEAFKRGIPAADIECGRLGMVEQLYVDKIVYGLTNLMHALAMTGQEPDAPGSVFMVGKRSSLSSSHTGFFYPNKSAGEYVQKGMKIGHITDFFNNKLEDAYAEADGIILYMLGTPPVNKGETLVSIGTFEN